MSAANASRRRLLGRDLDAGETAAVRQHLPALPLRLQPGHLAPDAQAFRQLGVDEHYRGRARASRRLPSRARSASVAGLGSRIVDRR